MQRAATVLLLFLLCLPSEAEASLREWLGEQASQASSWDYNLSVFEARLDGIFPQFLPEQRAELGARVRWARRQASLEQLALSRLIEHLERVRGASAGGGAFAGVRRSTLAEADRSYLRYVALLAPATLRALRALPRPPHQRLMARDSARAEADSLLAAAERTFLVHAERLVRRVSAAQQVRRRGFYEALQDLQLSRSPLDVHAWARLDRAVFQLQVASAEKVAPDLGVPEDPPFPVEALLAPRVRLRATPHAAGFEGLKSPLPGDPAGEEGALLSREAVRSKELDDLAARFPEERLRRDPASLAEAWRLFRDLRRRWDLNPAGEAVGGADGLLSGSAASR